MSDRTKAFVARYGAVYERSPWVAAEAAEVAGDVDDAVRLAGIMADCVDNAPHEKQLELIRAHPDLAGRAQVAGELTADSASEQASAGLDRCSAKEYERFQTLNRAYREKFGFPFVMAVRDCDRKRILDTFGMRLENDADTEFEIALAEIHEIARLRLEALESG